MPHHFTRHPTAISREVAEERFLLYFVEAKLGLSLEMAEEAASSDPELKDILDTAREIAARASVSYGGAT